MNRFFTSIAVLCTTAAALQADGVLPQPGTWRLSTYENADALHVSGNAVVGMNVTDPTAKRIFCSAEKELFPARSGDFTATFKLKYDQYDGNYTGETYLMLLDKYDGMIAQAGLNDRWQTGGKASGSTLWGCGAGNKAFPAMPIKGSITYRIERKNHNITIYANNIKLHERIGSTLPAAKVRLYFQEYRGKNFHPASFEYCDIEVKNDQLIKSSDVFEELPTSGFSNEWKIVERINTDGLLIDSSNGEMTVKGFLNPDTAKDLYRCTLERDLGKVEGDFTAALDMKWHLPLLKEYYVNNFMGEVVLQLYGANGQLLAETGLIDKYPRWNARAAAYIGGERKGDILIVPDKLAEQFIIRRSGKKYDIFLGAWHLDSLEGPTEAVSKMRLVFQQNFEVGKDGRKSSTLFAPFTIRRIAMGRSALDAPQPEVEKVCRRNSTWKLTKPMVAYWAGPAIDEEFARELVDGGWNQAWGSNIFDLDVMYRHGLRGHIWMTIDPVNEDNIRRLKLWLEGLRTHPATHAIHCNDEPIPKKNMHNAVLKVDFVRKHAPELMHFNNMHPFDATNEALGHPGDPVTAYKAFMDEYCRRLHPQIMSFDRYHFHPNGDNGGQFANFALVRERAMQLNVPYNAILQSCSWANWRRQARANEYYYLANIALAYGYKGLSSYVYGTAGHWGAMRDLETNKTTAMYEGTRRTNREFFSIASALFNLKSIAVYHAGEIPFMGVELPDNAVFQLEPKLKNVPQGLTPPKSHRAAEGDALNNVEPLKGYLLGYFGKNDNAPTHVMVVNLDYDARKVITVTAPSALERFEPHQSIWYPVGGSKAKLDLPPGGGMLLKLAGTAE